MLRLELDGRSGELEVALSMRRASILGRLDQLGSLSMKASCWADVEELGQQEDFRDVFRWRWGKGQSHIDPFRCTSTETGVAEA